MFKSKINRNQQIDGGDEEDNDSKDYIDIPQLDLFFGQSESGTTYNNISKYVRRQSYNDIYRLRHVD